MDKDYWSDALASLVMVGSVVVIGLTFMAGIVWVFRYHKTDGQASGRASFERVLPKAKDYGVHVVMVDGEEYILYTDSGAAAITPKIKK